MSGRIYVALPVLNERENLDALMQCIRQQTFRNFTLVACVNQMDSWWNDDLQKDKCINNAESIYFLEQIKDFPVHVIDRSSQGKGWSGKKHGVGWARKTCMDYINEIASPHDIILSMDADTAFSPKYFESVYTIFANHPSITVLCNPYYHKLTGDETCNRAILRYEIYLRYYLLNMLRIGSPYAFSALGSAIAVPVWAYRKIKGMVPKLSGEDFYFVQQLVKVGKCFSYNTEKVYPAARYSDRVPVGTGPAMIKGREHNWKSYPIYSYADFEEAAFFYNHLPALYKEDVQCTFIHFLEAIFKTTDLWSPLRKNFSSQEKFIKACHEKVDGLRIMQFLKHGHLLSNIHSDEENLKEFVLYYFGQDALSSLSLTTHFSFRTADIAHLNLIRDFLKAQCEIKLLEK